jgi:hypothetical protein
MYQVCRPCWCNLQVLLSQTVISSTEHNYWTKGNSALFCQIFHLPREPCNRSLSRTLNDSTTTFGVFRSTKLRRYKGFHSKKVIVKITGCDHPSTSERQRRYKRKLLGGSMSSATSGSGQHLLCPCSEQQKHKELQIEILYVELSLLIILTRNKT